MEWGVGNGEWEVGNGEWQLLDHSPLPFSYCFTNFSEAEFMQYRNPVGRGPSSKTWPRCPPQRLHITSTRRMPRLSSFSVSIFSFATGCQKLGQPVPESNLVFELNSSCPQAAQTKTPFS